MENNPSDPCHGKTFKEKLLETGASLTQNFAPLTNICAHVVGFHVYSGEPGRQIIAHHFCSQLNKDVRQCLIYDSNDRHARLIGVEYMVSRKIFETLPEDEKKYWHSHVCEVRSGALACPGLSIEEEKKVMSELVDTYGKTIHLWQIDKGHTLPLGPPTLMMSVTEENQINRDLVKKRDAEENINTEERKQSRSMLSYPIPDQKADQWAKSGIATVFEVEEVPVKYP